MPSSVNPHAPASFNASMSTSSWPFNEREIARIAPEISEDSEEILEAGGLVVGPGLIDTHVHFRDPGFTYKEDIHTGAKASAKGGFTTVICMANTSPTVDNESSGF